MKLSREDLAVFRPSQNKVLVRSVVQMNKIHLAGKDIFIDTTYKPEYHQEVICEVTAIPKKLVFDRKKPVGESMEWYTPIEVKKGDIVWCNYLSVLRGKEDFIIECEDITYFLIDYASIYLKKNRAEVTMLNGWILCEPVYVEPAKIDVGGRVIAVQEVKEFDELEGIPKNTQYGKVKHLGRPIKEYYYNETTYDDDYVRINDFVMFTTPHNVHLENDLHRHFDGSSLIVSRRSRLLGILDL